MSLVGGHALQTDTLFHVLFDELSYMVDRDWVALHHQLVCLRVCVDRTILRVHELCPSNNDCCWNEEL